MAISIKRVKNERGVKLGSLNIGDTFLYDSGDTFLYDNRVGVMVDRNGHAFPLDLTTCHEMTVHGTYPFCKALPLDTIVLPVEVEMTYKVVG